ncbi:serine/threonine-protein phosphatase 6 regulatory ankyrin repeat subunit C-like [Microplitis mediator]|uniref:serine/threonine-protein phosphatase 6 regulatory ankyrin repeat subunit C-like n=1 Tax=Microplitis mediator TaxID=375433 RepID=UPI0025538039|nr:serine/threonine-protein phosphatase 6 regulatory ankyrin repeat subunit C-like [Microplitis mediator]
MRKSRKQRSRIRQSRKQKLKMRKTSIGKSKCGDSARLFQNLISFIEFRKVENVTNIKINGTYRHYGTPLHMAAQIGSYYVFKKLIKIGGDIHKRIPKTQKTILHSALRSSNYKIIKYLIENGIDVNVALENHGDTTGETALHLAATTGTKEVIKLLLDNNADINAKNIKGITPIIRAVQAHNYGAMDTLIKYSPDLFCTYEENGVTKTIFHAAVDFNNLKVLFDWLYLFADTVDVSNSYNNFFSFFESQRLLHYALIRSIEADELIISLLLGVCVDVNALDSKDKLAIEYESTSECNLRCISAIKKHIVELIAAGFYVCDRNITAVSNMKRFDRYLVECQLEVERMKKNYIEGSNITFIEVLQKNERYLAPRLKSVNLKNIVECEILFLEYPLYEFKIFQKLRKTMKRVTYIKDSEEVILNIFHELHLPDTFIEELYFYLSNNDLENIIPPSTRKKYGLIIEEMYI